MLGPRFEELEYRDSVKHDRKRAESWEVQLSKRSAYDATEGMDVREALENCDGAGDAWESAPAVSCSSCHHSCTHRLNPWPSGSCLRCSYSCCSSRSPASPKAKTMRHVPAARPLRHHSSPSRRLRRR